MLYHNRNQNWRDDTTEETYNLHGFEDEFCKSRETLRQHADEFDVVAVQGMSGVIMGAPIALSLRKELVVVRKDTDTHNHQAMGNVINAAALKNGARCLFLDDLIASGHTRLAVEHAVEKRGGRIVAQFTYETTSYRKLWEGTDEA